MLVEKVGLTSFTVIGENNMRVMVNNEDFLTSFQEKQMINIPIPVPGYYYQHKGNQSLLFVLTFILRKFFFKK